MTTLANTKIEKISKKHRDAFRKLRDGNKYRIHGDGLARFEDGEVITDQTWDYLNDRVTDLDSYEIPFAPEPKAERKQPTHFEMIKEALTAANGPTSLKAVREYIKEKYGLEKNHFAIMLTRACVNNPKRCKPNQTIKPRLSTDGHWKDFAFKAAHGMFELYDPAMHGVWKFDGYEQVERVEPPTADFSRDDWELPEEFK